MTQLILDVDGYNVALPESRDGGYTVQKESLSVEIQMITGRIVREVRGSVWAITYQYGYLDQETKDGLIAACEKGRDEPIVCGFLPQNSMGALSYSSFFVTEFTRPKFMWAKENGAGEEAVATPLWADFSVSLREVRPHA